MAAYDIRVIGDPVLRQKANDVAEIDGALVKLVDDMLETMCGSRHRPGRAAGRRR